MKEYEKKGYREVKEEEKQNKDIEKIIDTLINGSTEDKHKILKGNKFK